MGLTHFKDLISQYTGLERDALHIHLALFVYLLAALLFRRSPRSPLPWLVVFGIELANEAHDLWVNWGAPWSWSLGEGAKDLWNTMLWPTVLLLVGRYGGLVRRPAPEAMDDATGMPPSDAGPGLPPPVVDSGPDGRLE